MTEKAKPTPRAGRPARRSIGLAPDPFADSTPTTQAARSAPDTPEPAVAVPAPAAAAKPRRASAKTTPAPVATAPRPVAAKAEPEIVNTDARSGEEYWGEPTFKLTVNIPASLHRRLAGLLLHQQITGEPADISSLTDAARLGLHHIASHAEKTLNNGEWFQAPKNGLRRGRR